MTTWRARRRFAGMTARSGVAHQPGLDGLRGLAVAAVLIFHTGLGWLPGGFLGVSLFFTLSGVVIGTVIIHELRATRSFSLRRFWGRRARRLLPAAWIVLALVAFGRLVTPRLSATSGGDVIASWLHVANWQFLAKDQSYQELFTGPSTLLHFWSLAIEEQFYLVVGLVAIGIAAVSKRPARTLGIVAGFGAVVSFVVPILLRPSIDRVYYGTDTRAGELLVGLVLASWLSASPRRVRLLAHGHWVALAGLIGLAATVVGWRSVAASDDIVRTGLLPATSAASAMLIVAAVVPSGPVFRLASLAPLRALGAISYGVYLIHWPLYVVIATFSPSPWWRLGLGVPLALALAVASARLVELPVRRRQIPRLGLGAGAVGLTGVLVVALAVPPQRSSTAEFLEELAEDASTRPAVTLPGAAVTTASPATTTPLDPTPAVTVTPTTTEPVDTTEPEDTTDLEDPTPADDTTDPQATTDPDDTTEPEDRTDPENARDPDDTVAPDTSTEPEDTTDPDDTTADTGPSAGALVLEPDVDDPPTTTTTPPELPTVGLFGDSIALSLALTKPHAPPSDRYVFGDGVADIGCGAILSPVPTDDGRCGTARSRWLDVVAGNDIELPVVMSCQWELLAQPIGDDPTPRVIGDPVVDQLLAAELNRLVQQLLDAGARRVAFVRCPLLSPTVGVEGLDAPLRESRDPARVQRWNQLLDEIDQRRRDVVTIDLAAWVDARRDDATIRPDGEHYRYEVDTGVAAELHRLLLRVV